MDRIDRLTLDLVGHQCALDSSTVVGDQDAMENLQARRDALRDEISADFRASEELVAELVGALETLLDILEYNKPRSDPNGEYTRGIEAAQVTLARVKGGEHG